MSYKVLLAALVFFFTHTVNADYEGNVTCNENGFCSLETETSLCSSGYDSNVRLDLRSNTYVYMCECNCTSQENYGWLARKDNSQFHIHKISASKIFKLSDILSVNGQIPDGFAPTRLCEDLNAPTDLILLTKIPSPGSNPSHPYCYVARNIAGKLGDCQSDQCRKTQKEIGALDKSLARTVLLAFLEKTRSLAVRPDGLKNFPRSDFIRTRVDQKNLIIYQQIYNDIAYFWQQAGYHREAIWLLEEILKVEPTRTVAHLNLADSLWAEGDTIQAKKHYQSYVLTMESRQKESLIPSRVFKRLAKWQKE